MTDILPVVGDIPWLSPLEFTPPKGRKIFLLTVEGTAIIGMWNTEGAYCGWRPLFKETPEIKRLRHTMRGY
jgi:hypothetical protein